MVKSKNFINKEEEEEEWCFVCKDGGSLRICDFRGCLKAYHHDCLGRDESWLVSEEKWKCGLHFCTVCEKAPKLYCLCCPSAICGHCISDVEFARIKGNKGLCKECLEQAMLIENPEDFNFQGQNIDSNAPDNVDEYFHEYWLIIKVKEHLSSDQVISAYNRLKTDASDTSDSDEGEDSDESDYDSEIRKRKRSKEKASVAKTRVKSSRKEFTSWGSRPLLDFLASIGKDPEKKLSDDAVTNIITAYCKENKLFDPKKKRKVNCDARLKSLFHRESVNRNSLTKHLATHLAENSILIKECGSSSEDEVEEESEAHSRKSSSLKKSHTTEAVVDIKKQSHTKEVVMDIRTSRFASVVPKNIKLVYLKKSLVEELSKQLDAFDAKVKGSFVRVRSDPMDYLQKNSYQLVQVIDIHKSSVSAEILLRVSDGVERIIPIHKLSDDDFSEEECEDLCQKVKNSQVERPTVVDLKHKAISLHEDITKHWIARELVLLQNRIDRANEKGWRREMYELLDKLVKLRSQPEQSRLLNEIPEVIADIIQPEPYYMDSTLKYEEDAKSSSKIAQRRTCDNPAPNLKATVKKAKTQTTASSDLEHRLGSRNEAFRSGMSCGDAMKIFGGEAPNSAAELLAHGSSEMNERGEENSNDVAQGYGKELKQYNSSSAGTGSHELTLIDQRTELKLVVEDIVKNSMKEYVDEYLKKNLKI